VQSLDTAPAGSESTIYIPFTVDTTGNYTVHARLNCPTYDDDSFWVKMDAEAFQLNNGLGTGGWEWKKFGDFTLTTGDHTLTIAYREDGAKLDKICISNSAFAPFGMGAAAENICTVTGIGQSTEMPGAYALDQNYPNPFNPVSTIRYELPRGSDVSLTVYNIHGREVARLVDTYKEQGFHELHWNGGEFASGIYIAHLVTPEYSSSIKMLLLK
jgi:hypothetical protein